MILLILIGMEIRKFLWDLVPGFKYVSNLRFFIMSNQLLNNWSPFSPFVSVGKWEMLVSLQKRVRHPQTEIWDFLTFVTTLHVDNKQLLFNLPLPHPWGHRLIYSLPCSPIQVDACRGNFSPAIAKKNISWRRYRLIILKIWYLGFIIAQDI